VTIALNSQMGVADYIRRSIARIKERTSIWQSFCVVGRMMTRFQIG